MGWGSALGVRREGFYYFMVRIDWDGAVFFTFSSFGGRGGAFFGILIYVSFPLMMLLFNLYHSGFADIFYFGAPPPGGRRSVFLLLSL